MASENTARNLRVGDVVTTSPDSRRLVVVQTIPVLYAAGIEVVDGGTYLSKPEKIDEPAVAREKFMGIDALAMAIARTITGDHLISPRSTALVEVAQSLRNGTLELDTSPEAERLQLAPAPTLLLSD